MKLIKSLLLGTAAGFAATAGVQAADLPSRKAAPVDYVRICSIGAFTGFVLPGSDTCLKIGGFARLDVAYNQPKWLAGNPGLGRNVNALNTRAQAQLEMDARTTTEYGLLRGFFRMRMSNNSGSIYNGGAGSGFGIDKAYVQFGGLHAGFIQSVFDFYADDASYGSAGLGSDHSVNSLGYTFGFGNFYAVVALEAPQRAVVSGVTPLYAGQRVPDLVAAVGVKDTWGSAQLSGAVHQISTPNRLVAGGLAAGNSDSEYGFAIQGGVKILIPQLGPSDALFLQAAYADGAVTYLGLPGQSFGNLNGAAYGSAYDFGYSSAGSIKKTTGYNVTAAFEHMWNPNWGTNIFGGYTKYDPSGTVGPNGFFFTSPTTLGTFAARKADIWQVGGNVTWYPVKGFKIGLEATYFDVRLNAPVVVAGGGVTKKSDSIVQTYLRIQRDF